MAGQSITFDFLTRGADKTASDFKRTGDNAALASRGAKVLADAIERLGGKEDRTAAESKILASALRQTGDAEDRMTAKTVLADAAIRRLDDSMQDSQKKAGGLGKALGGLKINPGLVGPALLLAPALASLSGVAAGAAAGLAGAFTAGGISLAAFGAIAKPVLTDAKTAATAASAAQDAHAAAIAKVTGQYTYAMSVAKTKAQRDAAYATEQKGFSAAGLTQAAALTKAYQDMSPAQIALSKQIGAMADAWKAVKAAETPVVAGALQPWLHAITDLMKQLKPVIDTVAPIIADLGGKFRALVNSDVMTRFREFVASFGAWAVSAAGSTIIDFFKAFMIILPQFAPLIGKATEGIAKLGPAVVKWAGSQKTADHITAFMGWFKANGPLVGQLLKNAGAALAALAPGLTGGAAAELQIISGFLGFVAKLPPGLAKPLAEVAGAMLILNKLGVVSVGLKLLGPGAAAGAGATAGLWSKLLPGVRLLGGALVAVVAVDMILKNTQGPGDKPGQNVFDNPFGADPKSKDTAKQGLSTWAGLGNQITQIWDTMWRNTITRTAAGFHDIAGWFDTGRHWVAARTAQTGTDIGNWWNITWNNTISRAARGVGDVEKWFGNLKAGAGLAWNQISTTASGAWNTIWANTVSRTSRGVGDVGKWLGSLQAGAAIAWAQIRGTAATVWNQIWANTVSRVVQGVSTVMNWLGTLPGRVRGIFASAGFWLISAGQQVLQGFWNGLTSIWGKVTSWISGIASWIKAHKGPVSLDASLLYPAGQAMMGGFLGGLKAGFGPVGSFVGGIASWVLGKVKGAGGKLTGGAIALDPSAFSSQALAGSVGGGVARWRGLVEQALKMEGLSLQLTDAVLYQMQTESGGNPNAINLTDSNAAAGDPSRGLMQTIMSTFRAYHWPGTSGNIYDPLANIAAAINYARHTYGPGLRTAYGGIGTGHGYAAGTSGAAPGWAWVGEKGPELVRMRGGEQVVPAGGLGGYAAGTAGAAAAYLKAWQTRHGGGFGAAWGPVPVNPQIDAMTAAINRATTLAAAKGLTAGQHRFWSAAAADDKRRLATLKRELTTERAWRTQLGGTSAQLGSWIRAAGTTPSLAGNVRAWKAQLAWQQWTIGNISGMLGLSAAQHAAAAKAKAASLAQGALATHTYGGDIANTTGATLAAALGPFTGTTATFDRGGWLKPGLSSVLNATGRPELLLPAHGGAGGVHLHLTVNGPVGSQQQLEDWYVRTANKMAQHGRLSHAVKTASR